MAHSDVSDDAGLLNRITLLEDLLKKVVEVHLSTAVHVKSLDEKLGRIEITSDTITNFLRRMDAESAEGFTPGEGRVSPELAQELVEMRKEVAELKATLQQIAERPDSLHLTATSPVAEQLDLLSQVPDLFDKVQSQQSTILQTLEKRIDPRLMIYLKPLIEMLEEEGRQAEEMKNNALKELNELLTGQRTGTDREIAGMLENVSGEMEKCQAAFERTQQALQIVVTPFQNVGRLFRNNLEIIVQAHDMMAQLHEDFPNFLEEMRRMQLSHAQKMERLRQEELMKHMAYQEQLKMLGVDASQG
ncbi:hypothetical protein SIID45300_02215 [Candidatus Magnetaquicoccaceae bacterium FCR-1]|uniref:Uncharacterized protein n=1 Tax=Candidatus Magnetaquiglobus chichijimensis TaxID=3141448 RepID=A0ABQ0CAH2_9PROT